VPAGPLEQMQHRVQVLLLHQVELVVTRVRHWVTPSGSSPWHSQGAGRWVACRWRGA
jgi:hypothetical protein